LNKSVSNAISLSLTWGSDLCLITLVISGGDEWKDSSLVLSVSDRRRFAGLSCEVGEVLQVHFELLAYACGVLLEMSLITSVFFFL
jgi:hypothetical protein